MQSASPSGRLRLDVEAVQAALRDRVREAMSGRIWLLILVFLLTYNVAASTASFHWVDGIEVVISLSLLAALVTAALALSPLPDWVGITAGAALTGPAALIASWSLIHQHHPKLSFGLGIFGEWSAEMKDGTLISDQSVFLFLICVLMWIAGGWLSWCVLRWRNPMLGVIPGAAALATNLLNIQPGSSDQNGYTFVMMVLIIALLLWSSYTTAIAYAKRMRMKLSGDARWDFWQTGLAAMAGVIVLSIFLPPLSTADRTLDVESGVFSSWAQLQQDLSHPGGFIGLGSGAGPGTTGFTDDVRLLGTLKRSHDIVFTYSVAGDYGGPKYFRGVNETTLTAGEWRYSPGGPVPVQKNQQVQFAETYDALGIAAFTVKMVHAPVGYSTVLFYPGQLFKLDRTATGRESPNFAPSATGLLSIDRLDSVQPPNSSGGYTVYAEYSGATVTQLQAAGVDYPDWVRQYTVLPTNGYRPPQVEARIRNLARVITAGTQNPYDAAAAIEAYLRDPRNFRYTLTPPVAPPGEDPIDWFLFQSHQGYCEFFATAMADMLRSLGIPTRLVNGFGPGTFEASTQQFIVRADDAHTWPEVYFPTYGWVPFEPTADSQNTYTPITRGQSAGAVCLREAGCDEPNTDTLPPLQTSTGAPTHPTAPPPTNGRSGGGLAAIVSLVFGGLAGKIVLLLVAVLLLAAAMAVRYLRPNTVMAVWNRTLLLAGLAGARAGPGETPWELGRRLKRSFPEAADPVTVLTDGFTVAAYAPPEVAAEARTSVMDAWTSLRPLLLRRVLARLGVGRL